MNEHKKAYSEYEIFYNKVKEWTINDYFTPNIKAEVIWDMLLSEIIGEIAAFGLKRPTQDIRFVSKELPIIDGNQTNKGSKIDYVLADEKDVYLVELKTTSGRFEYEQLKKYLYTITHHTFAFLENNLLRILNHKTDVCKSEDENLEKCITAFYNKKNPKNKLENITGHWLAVKESLRRILAKSNNPSSLKYYYSALQITHFDKKLSEKNLKLLYMMPTATIKNSLESTRGNNDTQALKNYIKEKTDKNIFFISLDEILRDEKEAFLESISETQKKTYAEMICNIWTEMRPHK